MSERIAPNPIVITMLVTAFERHGTNIHPCIGKKSWSESLTYEPETNKWYLWYNTDNNQSTHAIMLSAEEIQ